MLPAKVLAITLFSATAAAAQGAPMQPTGNQLTPTISSVASAEAKFTPDRATVSIAVQTRASTAAAAAADNAKKQSTVLSALRSLGLTNEQLSTTGYSVNPDYRYPKDSAAVITGYTVTNTVQADVHDLKQIGKVLDTALASGSNMISSLDFYSSNTDAARATALTEAVVKARAEAEIAAKAAGGTLGSLIHLTVNGGNATPPPRPMYMAKSMAAGAPETQINPGQQSLTVSVSASWHFVSGR